MKQNSNNSRIPENEENETGQPIGWPVFDWVPAEVPDGRVLEGRYCRLERLNAQRHAKALYAGEMLDRDGRNWTYLPLEAPASESEYCERIANFAASADPFFYAILDKEIDEAAGFASLLRINPVDGVIEVGYINFTPRLQRTRAATEAMFLLMRHVFEDLGYRRYEWKCHSLNNPSRNAALRFGFTYEGKFRQDKVIKGRNRDTAWFSIVDGEWPDRRATFEAWLAPDNFDATGAQRKSLGECRASISSQT